MMDSPIVKLVRQWLLVEAPLRGVADAGYQLRMQPVQQGRSSDRVIYMQVVGYKRYGWQLVEQVWDTGSSTMVRTETQSKETTFQFSVTQPADLIGDGLTHGDVLNLVSAALQGPEAVAFFVANGLSVLRVGDIRSIYWNNDQDRNEQDPSFDVVFKSNDVYINGVQVIDKFNFEIIPVPNLP